MINIDNKTCKLQIVGGTVEILDEILTVIDDLRDKINVDRDEYFLLLKFLSML